MKAKYNPITHDGEIEIALKEVSNFIDKIIPEAIKNAGGILGDEIRFWRFKNEIKIFKKAESLLGQDVSLHRIAL